MDKQITVWNTGRPYTKYGQRIAACLHEGVIVFVDVDRGLHGIIEVRKDAKYDLKTLVMHKYDNGLTSSIPEWESGEKGKVWREIRTMLTKAAEGYIEEKISINKKSIFLSRMIVCDNCDHVIPVKTGGYTMYDENKKVVGFLCDACGESVIRDNKIREIKNG